MNKKLLGALAPPILFSLALHRWRFLKQQSRRRHGANGFAFVPHTRRFLGRQSLGVELTVMAGAAVFTPVRPKNNSASLVGLKRKLNALEG
jgi:hypothetical protein